MRQSIRGGECLFVDSAQAGERDRIEVVGESTGWTPRSAMMCLCPPAQKPKPQIGLDIVSLSFILPAVLKPV